MTELPCTECASSPCACKSDIQSALDTLDDLLTAEGGLDALGVEDIDAVDDWANNVQLDIMRYRRLREGSWTRWNGSSKAPHGPAEPVSPVPADADAQEARDG